MIKKIKGFSLGGRFEWLVLVLILLGALFFGNICRSHGIFQPRPGKCCGIVKNIFGFSNGPSTSVVHVQPNFHIVTPGVWRSAKLNPESLKRMKTYGLKTIVNLRLDTEREPWEDALAKQLGIQCFHFPFSSDKVVPAKTVDAVLSILSDPARQPVLVHCAGGKDRTGMIIAAYRIAQKEWTFRDIYQEMMMYGYDTHLPEMLGTLRIWSAAHGFTKVVQEIALTEQKMSGPKKKL
jgi:protein tyrosine phosphatase (PTP) superfamily phosphohydrolase (DUF442 family)